MTRAEVRENLLVALDTLRTRKVRSALTILGIVIGVTSVISVAAIIDGLNGYIQGRIRSLGSQAIFVTRIPAGYTGLSRLPANIRARKYLRFDDGKYLMETVPSLSYATAFAQRINLGEVVDQITYGAQHVERMIVRGVEPDYTNAVPLFSVAEGRFDGVRTEIDVLEVNCEAFGKRCFAGAGIVLEQHMPSTREGGQQGADRRGLSVHDF